MSLLPVPATPVPNTFRSNCASPRHPDRQHSALPRGERHRRNKRSPSPACALEPQSVCRTEPYHSAKRLCSCDASIGFCHSSAVPKWVWYLRSTRVLGSERERFTHSECHVIRDMLLFSAADSVAAARNAAILNRVVPLRHARSSAKEAMTCYRNRDVT